MLSKKAIEQKIEEIRALINAEITPFYEGDGAAQSKRKLRAKDDFDFFFQTYMPNYSTFPPADYHLEFDKLLELRGGEIIGLCGPREHGKTARWLVAYELHEIVYRKRRFIMNISETEDMAILMNVEVRTHLESNTRLLQDFGNLRSIASWAENDFVTKNSVRVWARGYKQPVRSSLFGPHRPDFIRIDDISSMASSRNGYLEKQKMEWVLGELYGGMGEKGTLFWTGNVLRKSSAIYLFEQEARKPERDLIHKRLPCIMPGKTILWPQRYSMDFFVKKKRKVGSKVFEREWMQNPVEEGIFFAEDMFNRFSQEDASSLWNTMQRRIIYIDPSYGKKKKTSRSRGSDKKVAVVMGKNRAGYYIFDAISRQTSLEKFGRAVCQLYKAWNPPVIWYEGNFAQADLVGKFLNEAAEKEGVTLPKKPYFNFAPKADRIEKGNPFAENGLLWFVEGNADVQDIIDNLCMYPDVEFDDPADAYAAGLEILEKGPIKIKPKCWRT